MADLRAQLKTTLARVNKDLQATIRLAATGVAQGMVEKSTVDTGLFAANWLPDVNNLDTSYLNHAHFNVKESELDWPNERKIGISEALAIAQDIPEFKLGDEITWTNSVPYLKNEDNEDSFDYETDRFAGLQRGKELAQALVKGKL